MKRTQIGKTILLLSLTLCLLSGAAVRAADSPRTVVKVGFPIQSGTSYLNEKGEYAGYLVDYLTQLSLFTNWDIQYVQVEGDLDTQLETLMAMLQTGEIDMLGTMNRSDALEKYFLYPNYSYGTRYTVLAVPADSADWIEDDYSGWDGIRVAAYSGNLTQLSQLRYFAAVNSFHYTVQTYDTFAGALQAVQDGQADAVLQSDLSLAADYRIIGRFSPSPYYFALTSGDNELLWDLNTAMQALNSTQPNLQTELYNRYFRHLDSFQLSQEHRDYIQSLGTLRVLYSDGDAPFQYVKDGKLTGFAVQYLEQFAQLTGLQYEPVVAHSLEEAIQLIEDGAVDLIGCTTTNSTVASRTDVRFTVPFFNSFSVTVCTNPAPHEHTNDLEFRVNTEASLSDVQTQEGHAIRADYYSLSYYLRKQVVYDDVVVDWANTRDFSYAVAVTDALPQADVMVSLLNQYASSISSETKQGMLYRFSGEPVHYTLGEWFMVNGVRLFFCVLATVVLAAVFLLYRRNRRIAYQALLAENRLMHLTMYDSTTGAYNEPYFRKLLEERCAAREPLALVAFNIRGFKYINDTYGTKRADDVLWDIKCLLESSLSPEEFFCRSSADLFYMALKERSPETLTIRIDQLFDELASMAAVTLDGHPLSLYAGAVFVAASPAPFQVSHNMSYMMVALSHARQVNGHSVYIFDEALYRTEQLRYYIETHMQSALVRGEYQLYLQPKMNLLTWQIDEAEALVRWQPESHDMIFPNQFIPLFEENGFCIQLDLYMVEQVCKTLRAWMDQGIAPISISVNQSKSLFVREDYVDRLLAITRTYRISPRYIVLEILEGLAFENIDALNGTIQRLNDVGFRVSMDDFGSGYSSLNTLGKLKIDELKLDRLFLMDVVQQQNGPQSEVLASILALAKRLGIRTVVEGVETRESEEMIRAMHCDYGQGYYYSKPIPAEDFKVRFCTGPQEQ